MWTRSLPKKFLVCVCVRACVRAFCPCDRKNNSILCFTHNCTTVYLSSCSSAESGYNCDYHFHCDACKQYVCAVHTTGLLTLAEGPDTLSVSVVRLSRNSYTIRNFIGLLHWVSVGTDRIVGLSVMVDRSLKTLRWLVIIMGLLDSHGKCESMKWSAWRLSNEYECKSNLNYSFVSVVCYFLQNWNLLKFVICR